MKSGWKLTVLMLIAIIFVSGCTEIPTGAFLQGDSDCFPMWQCDDWSDCSLKDGFWRETRVCEDINSCNSDENMPSKAQECKPPARYETEMGETVNQCGIEIKLNSFINSKDIAYRNSEGESQFLSLTTEEFFIVPNIEITNNFRHDVKVGFEDFYIEDQDNNMYMPRCPIVTDKDFAYCQTGDDWHLGSRNIESSKKLSGNLIFFLPNTTTEANLLYSTQHVSYDCSFATVSWKVK